MISEGLDFVAENAEPIRKFTTWKRKCDFAQFIAFLKYLSKNKFDLAVTFQSPWWVNFGIWFMSVPLRGGVLSQWHSFLFLNQGLRQKRSQALVHEADYNFAVVHRALQEVETLPNTQKPHSLKAPSSGNTPKASPDLPSTAQRPSLKLVAPHKWSAPPNWGKYFVIHPGMAGSAKNWPQTHYIRCLEILLKETSLTAVMTGTLADETHLAEIKAHFSSHRNFVNFQNAVKGAELLDVLAGAEFVLAPSTGVLHLAASLQRPCFGIYSPVKVQHPRRWGPRGSSTFVFLPEEKSPEDPDVMEGISPQRVATQILDFLRGRE